MTDLKLPSGKIIDQGLGIDLFPVDGIPDDIELKEADDIFTEKNNVFIDYVQKYDAFKFITPKLGANVVK